MNSEAISTNQKPKYVIQTYIHIGLSDDENGVRFSAGYLTDLIIESKLVNENLGIKEKKGRWFGKEEEAVEIEYIWPLGDAKSLALNCEYVNDLNRLVFKKLHQTDILLTFNTTTENGYHVKSGRILLDH